LQPWKKAGWRSESIKTASESPHWKGKGGEEGRMTSMKNATKNSTKATWRGASHPYTDRGTLRRREGEI